MVVPSAQITASGAIAATASGQPAGSATIISIRAPRGIGASRRVSATSRSHGCSTHGLHHARADQPGRAGQQHAARLRHCDSPPGTSPKTWR